MILIIIFLIILYFIIKKNKEKFTNNNMYANTWYSSNYLNNKKDMQTIFTNNDVKNINKHKDFDDSNFNEKNQEHNDNEEILIKDIFDNSLINYKKYEKKIISDNSVITASSNLTFLNPNDWNYENEEILNGGIIAPGLYPNDDLTINNNSIF